MFQIGFLFHFHHHEYIAMFGVPFCSKTKNLKLQLFLLSFLLVLSEHAYLHPINCVLRRSHDCLCFPFLVMSCLLGQGESLEPAFRLQQSGQGMRRVQRVGLDGALQASGVPAIAGPPGGGEGSGEPAAQEPGRDRVLSAHS